MKKCSKCQETKPVDQFYKSKRHAGGLHCWCKDCSRQCQVERIAKIRDNPVTQNSGIKRCTKCLRELPVFMFGKNGQANDGLQWRCKTCMHENRQTAYESHFGLGRGKAAAKSKQQNKVVKYGESVVEAMEERSGRLSEDDARKIIYGF